MFIHHIDSIKKTCSLLENAPHAKSPMGQLVCKGLNELVSRAEEFDTLIASGVNYKKHFLGLLTSLHEMENPKTARPTGIIPTGHADMQALIMELFEDLAVFVRVRELNYGKKSLNEVEQAIQKYFEGCGEWLKDDNTLLSRSYWYELPLLFQAKGQ